MNGATKAEVRDLLNQLKPAPKPRVSGLLLKIGTGYAVMALFTMAALSYSFLNLYSINQTARRLANTDLPVVTTLIMMRSSVLAQEGFARKYAIFKDSIYIDLFRQRNEDTVSDLGILEKTNSAVDIAKLKRLYHDYQTTSERLFAGKSRGKEELHQAALRLVSVLDSMYLERQGSLQTVLTRADEQQQSTVRWAIGIACAGFLLSILIAPVAIYRVIGALGKLQVETHKIASGNYSYDPHVPALEEISDLTVDFRQMAAKLKEIEQLNEDILPATLPENLAIEKVLNDRLNSGDPFSVCHVELENSEPFLAQYGYTEMAELLYRTRSLIHTAVTSKGAAKDFAGHAGGHTYVMALSADKVAPVCDAVVLGFDAEVTRHLSPEDREAGDIRRCNGQGVQRAIPIMTVFITVLDCSIETYTSALDIARATVELKNSLKRGPGSSWDRAV